MSLDVINIIGGIFMAKDKAKNKREQVNSLGKNAEILEKMELLIKIVERIEKRLSGGFV